MLFVVKERLEGLKYNTDFRGRGWGYTGGGDRYVHYAKRVHFIEGSQNFCPLLQPLSGSEGGGHFVLMHFIHKNMICIYHFHIDHNVPSSIGLGTTVIPRRNWKQRLCKLLGAKKVHCGLHENSEFEKKYESKVTSNLASSQVQVFQDTTKKELVLVNVLQFLFGISSFIDVFTMKMYIKV